MQFNSNTCECECVPQFCSINYYFEPAFCACACNTGLPCDAGYVLNTDLCACECVHRNDCPKNNYFDDVLCGCFCDEETTCDAGYAFNTETCDCECVVLTNEECGDYQIFDLENC